MKRLVASNIASSWELPLPHDITANILQRLGVEEILETAQKVCMTWRRVCKFDPSMWRKIHLVRDWLRGDDGEMMCQQAVDRSQGQLLETTLIGRFCNDALLHYIADRSSQLKYLVLSSYKVTEEGLVEATKRFPLLETLYIDSVLISDESIEQIGRSCPMLKSFNYSPGFLSRGDDDDDTDALAIAKSMSELRHLRLVKGNPVTNKGLEAILDGCPNLESLDLQLCVKFDLSGDLGNKCSQRIKFLNIVDTPYDDDPYDGFDTSGHYDYEPSDDDNYYNHYG